jgi:hypothetical protein
LLLFGGPVVQPVSTKKKKKDTKNNMKYLRWHGLEQPALAECDLWFDHNVFVLFQSAQCHNHIIIRTISGPFFLTHLLIVYACFCRPLKLFFRPRLERCCG